MIVYMPENTNSTRIIIGQIEIIDPDVRETFTMTFDKSNIQALLPESNPYTIISDNGSVDYVRKLFYYYFNFYLFSIQAQIYNISIMDLNPPQGQIAHFINVTANITDSGNHSLTYRFSVKYIPRLINNSTIISTIPPPTTTTVSLSLSQALHIRIYETTPPNTPIVRGLITSSSNKSFPSCTAIDDKGFSFPINSSQSSFIIYLPSNYTLNSTVRSSIIVNVKCKIGNDTNVNQVGFLFIK